MLNLLPSILVLGLAALGAIFLAQNRRSSPEMIAERKVAARVLGLAVMVQSIHFAEEAATGFHERLPALLGLQDIPFSVFIIFNLLWLAIWVASIPGLRAAHTGAFFAAWFLAIAGMVNGVAHPLLAVAQGGYFPGLVSSPIEGIACVWLWLRLRAATQPVGDLG